MHHDPIPCAAPIVSCKHDVILRGGQERCQTRSMIFLVTLSHGFQEPNPDVNPFITNEFPCQVKLHVKPKRISRCNHNVFHLEKLKDLT